MSRQAILSAAVLFLAPAVVAIVLAGCSGESQSPATTGVNHDKAAENAAAGDYGRDAPFDPVLANGEIFEGWPKPKAAIVITGSQDGYLEPCGCTGLQNQKGGLARRHTMLRQLRENGWPLAVVDVGGLVGRFGKQAEIKYQIAAEGLSGMQYDAVGFGPKDLRLPVEGLAAAAANDNSPFVAANVDLFGLNKPYKIIEAGPVKVGVTAVLGAKHRDGVNNPEISLTDEVEALRKLLPELQQQADYLVLLANAELEEAQALAKQFPEFHVVVSSGGAEEPPYKPDTLNDGKTLLVQVGHKGMYAMVLGLYDDAENPVRYQKAPLDARFADSPDMKQLMVAYQGQLAELGFAGLDLRPQRHPTVETGVAGSGEFVGAAKCGECHKQAYATWSGSKHAHATEALANADPPRLHDPECLSCHVTGWSPQEYLPFETGYASLEETPLLTGNGCENCHGPGAAHVAAEGGTDLTLRSKLRESMKRTQATAELNLCINCHDQDNDPNFKGNFAAYWKKIEHKGTK